MLDNPRETQDCFCHLELHHRRYDLTDDSNGNHRDIPTYELYRKHLERCHDAAICLPVFGYDHSTFDIATEIRPYWWHYSWDGGRLGFAWVSKDDIRKNWNVKRVTPALIIKARALIVAEVDAYASYLRGDADDDSCTGDDETEE